MKGIRDPRSNKVQDQKSENRKEKKEKICKNNPKPKPKHEKSIDEMEWKERQPILWYKQCWIRIRKHAREYRPVVKLRFASSCLALSRAKLMELWGLSNQDDGWISILRMVFINQFERASQGLVLWFRESRRCMVCMVIMQRQQKMHA